MNASVPATACVNLDPLKRLFTPADCICHMLCANGFRSRDCTVGAASQLQSGNALPYHSSSGDTADPGGAAGEGLDRHSASSEAAPANAKSDSSMAYDLTKLAKVHVTQHHGHHAAPAATSAVAAVAITSVPTAAAPAHVSPAPVHAPHEAASVPMRRAPASTWSAEGGYAA